MTDRTQGDPLISITEDGANITYLGGQPIMDQGLINLALISLGTKPDDALNVLYDKDSEKHQIDLEKYKNEPITIDSLNEQRNDTIAALDGLKEEGQADEIIVDVTNPSGYIRKTVITIVPPGKDSGILQLTNYGSNWQAQILNPAANET